MKVVVLASGRGSNLAALLAARDAGTLPIDIAGVYGDKPAAPALDLARAAGIPALALRPKDYEDRLAFDRALFAQVARHEPRLVVCAGYMRILSDDVVRAQHGRMINIHPSLLPQYPGLHTHRRVLEAGDAVHGASVHFVTTELDGGPVIARARMPVQAGDDEAALAARLLPLEHRLLVATVELLARRLAWPTPSGVTIDGRLLDAPLALRGEQLHDAGGFVA